MKFEKDGHKGILLTNFDSLVRNFREVHKSLIVANISRREPVFAIFKWVYWS